MKEGDDDKNLLEISDKTGTGGGKQRPHRIEHIQFPVSEGNVKKPQPQINHRVGDQMPQWKCFTECVDWDQSVAEGGA